MNSLNHLVVTALAYMIIDAVAPLPVRVLIAALFLTILIDVLDHVPCILLQKTSMHAHTRRLIRQCRIIEAYKYYYDNRKIPNKSYLHNIYFVALITAIAIYLQNAAFFLGVAFHFYTDIAEAFIQGNPGIWIPGMKK